MGREGEAGRPGPTGRGLCRARRRLWVSNAKSGPHWSGRIPARCNEDAVGITATSGRLAQTHSAASVPSLPLTVLTGSEGGRWLPGVSGLFRVPAGPRAPSGPAPVPGPCAQRPRPHGVDTPRPAPEGSSRGGPRVGQAAARVSWGRLFSCLRSRAGRRPGRAEARLAGVPGAAARGAAPARSVDAARSFPHSPDAH